MPLTPSTLAVRALAFALGFAMSFVGREQAFAAIQCAGIFAVSPSSAELNLSVEDSILALARMRLDIDRERVKGPTSLTFAALNSSYAKKEKQLSDHLEQQGVMNRSELREKIKDAIHFLQNKKALAPTPEEIQKEDQFKFIRGQRGVFHKIMPGQYLLGEHKWYKRDKKVTLTKAFELMSTPTTQYIWERVVLLAQSKLQDSNNDYASMQVHPSRQRGDRYPVVQVSYLHVQLWIKALNELSLRGESELAQLIVGHQQGNKYRLPTEAEWDFVVRGRGELNEKHPFGEEPNAIDDYAWTLDNSNFQTQPVGMKKPLKVDGKEFFDMLGNVQEWVSDYYLPTPATGVNPVAVAPPGATKDVRTVRGGSIGFNAKKLTSSVRGEKLTDFVSWDLGFRLAREVQP